MCLIPIEYINLCKLVFLDFSIELFKFFTDNSPQPSRFFIKLKSSLKISCGFLSNFKFQNFSTTFFPNPSILRASLEIKCFIFSIDILSHPKPSFVHLLTASNFLVVLLNSLIVLDPQDGHFVGNLKGFELLFLLDMSTSIT